LNWYRILGGAGLGLLVLGAITVGLPWFSVFVGNPAVQPLILRLLRAARAAYGALVVTVPVAWSALAITLWRARGPGLRSCGLFPGFVLCSALMLSLALAEATAAVWLAWMQGATPRLPTRFPYPPADLAYGNRDNPDDHKPWPARFSIRPDDDTVDIVVIGESSACGYPYHAWLSVGEIVAWKLREAIPNRRFRVELAARFGISLAYAHDLLSGLERRPDLVILYAGHNEFVTRYAWDRTPPHYLDEALPVSVELRSIAHRVSPLSRLIEQTIATYRVSAPPPHRARRTLVGVPVYTPSEYAERLHEFRTRIEAITGDCERLGALVVLMPPPGNEADFEPNQSYLRPETPRVHREPFAREFEAAQQTEPADPVRAIAAYRALLARQPGFAEAHYRLGRLLEATGRRDEANRHYAAARDCDGYPVRCMSEFLQAYRELAARHPHAILVDGPEVFRRLSPRGTVGGEFLADANHPSLVGYTALSQAILDELYARRAFGWSASSPSPVVTPADCAAHFGMDSKKWLFLRRRLSWFYEASARIRFDPSQRLGRSDCYKEAVQRIRNGTNPEMVHLPGIGTGGLVVQDRRSRNEVNLRSGLN
jgi:hypothetical protein